MINSAIVSLMAKSSRKNWSVSKRTDSGNCARGNTLHRLTSGKRTFSQRARDLAAPLITDFSFRRFMRFHALQTLTLTELCTTPGALMRLTMKYIQTIMAELVKRTARLHNIINVAL